MTCELEGGGMLSACLQGGGACSQEGVGGPGLGYKANGCSDWPPPIGSVRLVAPGAAAAGGGAAGEGPPGPDVRRRPSGRCPPSPPVARTHPNPQAPPEPLAPTPKSLAPPRAVGPPPVCLNLVPLSCKWLLGLFG